MMYYGFGIDSESIRTKELAFGLEFATVAEIKELIDRLKLPLKKSARKRTLIDAIIPLLTAHPEYLIKKMTGAEISVVKQLMAGKRIIGDCRVLQQFYLLVKAGWIAMKEVDGSQYACEMILREEAEELLRPLLIKSQSTIHARIMQFIDGWAAMCGMLPVNQIVAYIVKQPGFEDVTFADVMDTLMEYSESRFLMHESIFNSGQGDIIYITPWSDIVGNCSKLLFKNIDVDGTSVQINAFDPVEFSYQEIMDASIFLFAPQTPNAAERKRLKEICLKNGLNDSQTDDLLLEAWTEKQKDHDSLKMGLFLEKFRFNSINEINEVISSITDYMNTLPFWRFLGHSSKEIAAKECAESKRAPRIVAGPNMRAMGMDVPVGLQEEMDRLWATSRQRSSDKPTVGRNDPCPCGSGKKYKHCCGK